MTVSIVEAGVGVHVIVCDNVGVIVGLGVGYVVEVFFN